MQGRHAEKGAWYPIWAKNKGAPYLTNIRVPRMDQNLGGPLFCKKMGKIWENRLFFSKFLLFFPKIFLFFSLKFFQNFSVLLEEFLKFFEEIFVTRCWKVKKSLTLGTQFCPKNRGPLSCTRGGTQLLVQDRGRIRHAFCK